MKPSYADPDFVAGVVLMVIAGCVTVAITAWLGWIAGLAYVVVDLAFCLFRAWNAVRKDRES